MKTASPLIGLVEKRQIQELAHLLWEQAGCPPLHDLDFWLAAENHLMEERRAEQDPFIRAAREDAARVRPWAARTPLVPRRPPARTFALTAV